MVLLWKGKLTNQNQSLFNPRILEIQEESYWFHNIYDSWKDYDSLERQWLIIQREIEIERSSLKDYDWFWMESWKLENSWEDNQTNLRKSTHRAHIHETLKKLAYSRVYPYTHALFFKIFIVNTKYLQLVWGQPWHDSAKPGCPKPYIVRRNMLCACF